MAAIGDYEIGEELGHGPLGKVYTATQLSTGRTVVFRGFTKPEDAEDVIWDQCIQRYTEELTAARELKHPNIAEVYDFGVVDNVYWVTTEYFSGRTLVQILDREGKKDPGFVTELYEQLGAALGYALGKGLIHSDLTPYNILQLENGVWKLINFGLGHIREKWGSPYAAPEQVRNEAPDATSDVFSLGVLGYECLAADPPFIRHDDDATAAAVLADEPEPIDGVGEAPMAVLLKMMAKDREDRYEDAPAAVAAFEESLTSGLRPKPSMPERERERRRKGRVMDPRPSLSHFNLKDSDARSAIESLRRRLTHSGAR